jgi:hypothetical protein
MPGQRVKGEASPAFAALDPPTGEAAAEEV